MEKKVHIYFSGRVQGVGFRFTCRSIAARYKIKGWVKNLFDGRVEMVAQGDSSKINGLLQDLRGEFRGYIDDEDLQWLEPDDSLEGFSIKF